MSPDEREAVRVVLHAIDTHMLVRSTEFDHDPMWALTAVPLLRALAVLEKAQENQMRIEYRVRPVTRYQVTRYHDGERSGGCDTKGIFDNGEVAYQVAYALASEESNRLGLPPGDMTVIFPSLPDGESVPQNAQLGS